MTFLHSSIKFRFYNFYVVLCIFILMLSACGDDINSPQDTVPETGTIIFRIALKDASNGNTVRHANAFTNCSDIDTVSAKVFDQDGNSLKDGGPWPCTDHEGLIKGVPAGTGRMLEIYGNNAEGHILYKGEKANIIVTANKKEDIGKVYAEFVGGFQHAHDADQDGDGYTPSNGDCDDTDDNIHPGAEETCNEVDDDCDGTTDLEGCGQSDLIWYRDSDEDGYGDPNSSRWSDAQPEGYVADNTDCDDTDNKIHPWAPEVCYNNKDDDCDGYTDEEVCDQIIMIGDNDGYGYGSDVVPDNEDLPFSDDPVNNWIFDNREPSEISATDGSQYTDMEPYDYMYFSFTIPFDPVDSDIFYCAFFTLDVSGLQSELYGAKSLYLDGEDFSSALQYKEQGAFGSEVIDIYIGESYSYLFTNDTNRDLTVEFYGGYYCPDCDLDSIAFDYLSLEIWTFSQ